MCISAEITIKVALSNKNTLQHKVEESPPEAFSLSCTVSQNTLLPSWPRAFGMASQASSLIFSVTRAHQQKYFKGSVYLDIMERAEHDPHSCARLSRLSQQPHRLKHRMRASPAGSVHYTNWTRCRMVFTTSCNQSLVLLSIVCHIFLS